MKTQFCLLTIDHMDHLCIGDDALSIFMFAVGVACLYFYLRMVDKEESYSGPHPLLPFVWKDFSKEKDPQVFRQRKSMIVMMLWIFSGILIFKIGSLIFS